MSNPELRDEARKISDRIRTIISEAVTLHAKATSAQGRSLGEISLHGRRPSSAVSRTVRAANSHDDWPVSRHSRALGLPVPATHPTCFPTDEEPTQASDADVWFVNAPCDATLPRGRAPRAGPPQRAP
jgi:hypothetical protein